MRTIERAQILQIKQKLQNNPVVALLGPRQCGKSTIAKQYLSDIPNSVYLDLEKSKDLAKINDVWAFFELHKGKLICLDEIQLLPEIFSQIRSYVDEEGINGKFLVLGSASRDLIKQSPQTLAGRISHIEMTPFRFSELSSKKAKENLLLLGGYPRSYLASSNEESFDWRKDYIKTFLERDIPSLGFRVPSPILSRFWTMLAHSHGQILNQNKLATSLGVTSNTIKQYLYILEETFMVRNLKPFYANIKKRMVKSPKVYLRDSGIVHALLDIETPENLLGHPVYGFSYEGYIIENLIARYPRHEPFYFRTARGDEIDLVLVKGQEKIAFEIKSSTVPEVESGFWRSLELLSPDEAYIIANVDSSYSYQNNVFVHSLETFLRT